MKQTRREFVRILFVASQAVVAGRFLPSSLLAETPPQITPSGGLNFLVFGDWGRQGEQDQVEVAGQMARTAKAINPQFVISVGDNFYEDGVRSVDDPHWQKSFEEVYRDPALQVPWHCILGNHDYRANCDAQIAYHKINPRWNMPARYYVQSHQVDALTTADFFYLDTTPMLKSYHTNGREGHPGQCAYAGCSPTTGLVQVRFKSIAGAMENCLRPPSDLFRRRPWRHAGIDRTHSAVAATV